MKKNENWVIALDHTDMDNNLLKYTSGLAAILHPKKIYLVTVLKDKKSYSYLPEEFFDFMNQGEEELKLRMKMRVEKHITNSSINFEYVITYGNPLDEIIHLVMDKSASLVLAGKKRSSGGSGVVSERLSRNLPCNVLIVPEESVFTLDNVLVPTDFSEHSQLAMEVAGQIHEAKNDTHVFLYHGYAVPTGYSKSGKSYEEFAEIMKLNAEKALKRESDKINFKINTLCSLADDSPIEKILSLVKDKSINLIIMGSKGQSAASLALLGSHTMKVVAKNYETPLLIVKKPDENIDFLKALGQI